MRRHRFVSMIHVAVRRCTEQRRLCTAVPMRLRKPIKRKQMRRKRV